MEINKTKQCNTNVTLVNEKIKQQELYLKNIKFGTISSGSYLLSADMILIEHKIDVI